MDLVAVSLAGVPDGCPPTIYGNVSRPVFDAAGLIRVTVGSPDEPPAKTLVFDGPGRAVRRGWKRDLDIVATSEWWVLELLNPVWPDRRG